VKRGKTPTFLVELPLATNEAQAKHLRAHLEAARSLYNALLGEAMKRLDLMRADSRWQEARRLPKTDKNSRAALFSSLRSQYGFSEYALHDYAKLSQYCHDCQTYRKKPLSQRWHICPCGIGPIQRDLYSAFLLAFLNPTDTLPSIAQQDWEGAEPRLLTAVECLKQRANEGQILPRSMGIPRAGARQSKSLVDPQQERSASLLLYRKGRFAALCERQEPPAF
jgi:hypothetical protein